MIIEIWLHASKEASIDAGIKAGLTGEALETFAYAAYEVKLGLSVNESTGEAIIVEVDGNPVIRDQHKL